MKYLMLVLLATLLFVMPVAAVQPEAVPDSMIRDLAWSPDGQIIAISGGNSSCATNEIDMYSVFLFDQSKQGVSQVLTDHQCDVIHLDWNNSGTNLISGGFDSRIRLWNVKSGELILKGSPALPGGVSAIAFSPDGNFVAQAWAEQQEFEIWDVTNGQSIKLFRLPSEYSSNKTLALIWHPDGEVIISAGITSFNNPEGFIRYWNVQTGELLRQLDHPGGVFSLAMRPDGSQFASGSGNSEIRIWELETGELLQTLNGDGGKLEWHPYDHLIAGGSGGDQSTIRVWNTITGEVASTYETDAWRPSVAWSPFGGRLVYTEQSTLAFNGEQQALIDGAVNFVSPAPSLDKLDKVAELCRIKAPEESQRTVPLISPQTIETITVDTLPDFITQLQALPEGAIPPACAADLIAVAEAVIAQGE